MSLNLDLSNAVEQGKVIPASKYNCVVEKAEVSPTKTGGEMIKLQLKIMDQGPWFGRSLFDNFNIKNNNPQAVQIGCGQLKTFMRAAGHPNPNRLESTTELMGLKVVVSTKIETDPQYGENARVKGYSPLVTPTMNGTATVTTATTANPFA